MNVKRQSQKAIQVCAHWYGMADPVVMGVLYASPSRGKEIFSFKYDSAWLKSPYVSLLDPNLVLFSGPQYPREGHDNFGVFLDSCPDRWGRVLMQRREAQLAKLEDREIRALMESDYLLGVYDGHRMGALRFRFADGAPFLDNQQEMATPPWTKLRDLEYASSQLELDNAEHDKDYANWLKILIAPGGSLGGARPKAGVLDEHGNPWIAKFPSRRDEVNIGRWEYLVAKLAHAAGVQTSNSDIRNFAGAGEYDTFLSKRFDRTDNGERVHFASAMTLLGKQDGDGGENGVSYLNLAEFLIKNGAQVNSDLEQLWRRIVFYACVSNTDDHLRNHGFLLRDKGWVLSPAYDMNPVATGGGLALNISKDDNSQSLDLIRSVALDFRISSQRAEEIIAEVVDAVRGWKGLAKQLKLPSREINVVEGAFRLVEGGF